MLRGLCAYKQSIRLFYRIAVLTMVTLVLVACSKVDPTYSIATGGPAGLYYPIGGGMASIWSDHLPNVNVKAEVTGGSVTNVIQVAKKESDLGIAMADVVTNAYHGRGRFPDALPLRVLLTAYPNIVHILTLEESGIDVVGDFVGKRVSLGAAGSGTAVAAENVLTSLGIGLEQVSPVYLSFAETTSALKDGTIDAGFVVGGLGLAAVRELSVTRNLRLVGLSKEERARVHESYPSYAGYEIPAQTYTGIQESVGALGIWSAVVVHKDMPESLAYQLTCSIYANIEELLRVSPVAEAMTISNIRQLRVPLHDGTERYLQDPRKDCADELG